MVPLNEAEKRFVQAVGFLSGLCIFFYTYRVLMTQSFRFEFIFGNLALAWLGLIFGWLLVRKLKSKRWTNWESILLTVLWLMFLPNTWYVLTDFFACSHSNHFAFQLCDLLGARPALEQLGCYY
jgi:uncharacterized membrane protein